MEMSVVLNGLAYRLAAGEERLLRVPAGEYTLCFRPNLVPQRGVSWDRGSDQCYQFELIETDTIAAQLELLRRKAVDALADNDCRKTTAIVDAMLEIDQASAVAYRIRAAVEGLASPYRTVLLLWAVEDLHYREIAEVLGIALGTVMSRLHRARAALVEQLEDVAAEHRLPIGAN